MSKFTCRLLTKFPAVISLSDSCQDGVRQPFSGSIFTGLIRRRKSSSTQSMIRMMRWGGRPSVRTVAMSAGLIVWVGDTERDEFTLSVSEACRQDCSRSFPPGSQTLRGTSLRQEAAVHQDQNLTPQHKLLPGCSWPYQQGPGPPPDLDSYPAPTP